MIDWLVEYQFQQEWTDLEMATALGISRVYWNLLKNRRARPGRKVVQATLARFPQATDLVLECSAAQFLW